VVDSVVVLWWSLVLHVVCNFAQIFGAKDVQLFAVCLLKLVLPKKNSGNAG
jgi:hypothetical protein